MGVEFSVVEGRLTIEKTATSERWQDFVDGVAVVDLVVRADGNSAVVLVETPGGVGRSQNIICIDSDAHVVWYAQLASSGPTDSYTSIEQVCGGEISAFSWSGYRVVIDPGNGNIISKNFVK